MEKINKLLAGHSTPTIRSALYYLGRYIKQAEIFINNEKDIFEDSVESTPSEIVKQLTLSLIDVIEEISNKKASEFSEKEFYFWMDFISELENKIDPELTEIDIQKALKQISQFKKPNNSAS